MSKSQQFTGVIAPSLAVLLFLFGCGSDQGPCVESEYINLSTPLTVEYAGQTYVDSVGGRFDASSAEDEAGWQAFRHFHLGDISQTAGGATWLMYDVLHATTSHVGEIGIQLAGSFQPGDVVQVTLAPSSISNGALGSAPDGARGAYVAAGTVADGEWIATAVSGTIEVLAVAPLRLRFDLLASNDPGQEMRIRGDMTASLEHYTCN
jgi:hypothetical protein